MKRIISVLLVLVMLISLVPTTVFATDNEIAAEANTENATIVEDGGLGSLIANSLEEQEANQQDGDIENQILDVSIEDKIATVTFNNSVDCKIIVSIYDENSKIMVGSGMDTFEPDAESGEIELNIETMPDYYVIKAFIMDLKNNPLNGAFESDEYTKKHQEFLATTIEDFKDEIVLSFDGSYDNNFAVFNEDTVIIDETEEYNKLVSSNVEELTFVFSDADATLSECKVGDAFYYTALNEEVVAGKIASITNDGTYITIISEPEIGLDDVFVFAKIDTSSNGEGAKVDTSVADEGVVYEGSESISPFSLVDVNQGFKHTFSIEKEIKSKDSTVKVKFSAALTCGFNVGFKVDLQDKALKIDFQLKEDVTIQGTISGSVTLLDIPLAEVVIPLGSTGIDVKVEPSVVIEFSGSVTFSYQLESTKGFQLNTKTGFKNTSKPVKFTSDMEFNGRAYFGLRVKFAIEALKILELSASGEAGAEILVNSKQTDYNDEVKHICAKCENGEINGVFSFKVGASAKANIPFIDLKYENEVTLIEKKFHLFDFYISSDLGFGLEKCPNEMYKVKFNVVDSSGKPIPEVKVGGLTTDSNGKAEDFYKAGNYTFVAEKECYNTNFVDVNVSGACTVDITLNKENQTSGSGSIIKENYGVNPGTGSMGLNNIKWKLYSNGTLEISGSGPINFEYVDSEGYSYLGMSPWSQDYRIKKVIIKEGITSLGNDAFSDCESLSSVILPSTLKTIGNRAFQYCTSLTNIVLPDGVTEIGLFAFQGSGLTNIILPIKLKTLDSYAFDDCANLKNIFIGRQNIYFSSVGGVLFDKFQTEIIVYPEGKEASKYTIPNTVKIIKSNAFRGCESLTEISIPKGVTTIESWAFYGCENLKAIGIPSTVTKIESRAFTNCDNLSTILVDSKNKNYSSGAEYVLLNKAGTVLISYPAGKSSKTCKIPYGVVTVGEYAFEDYDGISTLLVPSTVKNIEYHAFGSGYRIGEVCYGSSKSAWNSINIGDWNDSIISAKKTYNVWTADSTVFSARSTSGDNYLLTQTVPLAQTGSTYTANVTEDESGVAVVTTSENIISETIEKDDLVPNSDYVLMVVKGYQDDYVVSTDSLLYIDGATSDEAGTICMDYYINETSEAFVVVLFGECKHSLGDWCVVNDPTYMDTGLKMKQCTKCNEVLASEEIPALGLPDIYLSGMTITLDGGVSINYYMNLADEIVADENAKVVFTLPNGNKKSVAVSSVTPDEDGNYVFTCEVAAKEMTESITAQVITSDDKSEVFEYSVLDYADYVLTEAEAGNETYTAAAPLVKAMLNYGAYAQKHFGYNTENLANDILDDEDKVLAEDIDLSEYNYILTDNDDNVDYYGSKLTLESETAIKHYFTVEDEENIPVITVNGKEVSAKKKGEVYEVKISDIPAQNLDEKIIVEFGDLTLDYNALSYAKLAMQSGEEKLKDTMKALYEYNVAAKEYIAQQ